MADRVRPRTLEVAHPNAAGIDIGSGSHFVAVREDLHEQPVREFGRRSAGMCSVVGNCTPTTRAACARSGPRAHEDGLLVDVRAR